MSENQQLWIIGIGASAGGLEALTQFVAHVPLLPSASYIIAQHLAPHSKSMLVELLSKHSTLPIVSAQPQQLMTPGYIYIVPPNHDVEFQDGRIVLKRAGSETRPKPSVDTFFISLARVFGPRAVGIILSGTGSDGAAGIRAIKAAGGLTLAQDDQTARYTGMPHSAVETGDIDHVLPPAEMAKQLVSILETHIQAPISADTRAVDALQGIFQLLHQSCGSDFSKYKISTIQRRIERRMAATHQETLDSYLKYLKETPAELGFLAQEMLISVTSFFRDADAFELAEEKLTEIILAKRTDEEVRIWVAGCATGEEAYSYAIIVLEILRKSERHLPVKIFATDIDQEAISEARNGIYNEGDLKDISDDLKNRYFDRRDGAYSIRKTIRDLVVFARQDLIQNPPFVKLDFISCRNVMIYFKADVQRRVIEIFHYALSPGGFLLLGKSESLSASGHLFETLDRKVRLYTKINVPSKYVPSATNHFLSSSRSQFRQRAQHTPNLAEIAQRQLMSLVGISGVVIDIDCAVLSVIGDVSPYVNIREGSGDFHLTNLLESEIRLELPILVRKAQKERAAQESRLHKVEQNGVVRSYKVAVAPLKVESNKESPNHFLVAFEKKNEQPVAEVPLQSTDGDVSVRIFELEQELSVTREHLNTVIEELGISNEELQSLNEELSSTNEELQSANEELETTNEELQSTNEELTTLNEELSIKSSELRFANANLENINSSIGSPLIVIDQNLKVQRFNPDAKRIFALATSDIGREIHRISCYCEIPNLASRLENVLSSGTLDASIVEAGQTVYQLRIFPCRDDQNRVVGAILFFIDNTEIIRAEERIRQSEGRIRAIINGSMGLISLKDTLGRYLVVNDAFRNFFKLEERDVLGKTDREIFSDRMATQFRDADLEVILKRDSIRREETFVAPSGDEFAFTSRRFPLFDGKDVNPYAVGTISFDVSIQAKMQGELLKSEARYRSVIEDQTVFVCRHSATGELVFVNGAFCSYFGGTQENNLGQNFMNVVDPVDRSYVKDLLGSLSPAHPVVQYEHRVSRLGSVKWVRWIHKALFDLNGNLFEFQGVGFDVTDYRLQTDTLLAKETLFTSIFNQTTDFLTVYRVVGPKELVLESFNQSAEQSSGHLYSRFIGRRLEELYDPVRSEATIEKFNDAVSTGQVQFVDEEIESPSGVRCQFTTLVPIPGDNGKIERVAALSRDVSRFRKIEMELRRAKDKAEIANRSKTDFLASMSHELRTPLNVVIGMSQLLEDSHLDPDQRKLLDSIQRSGNVLLGLIEDILDISKIEAGKIRLEAQPLSLIDMIRDVVDSFSLQAASKGITVKSENIESARFLLKGDAGRLRQVLVNLVSNAIKFTEVGSVTIRVTGTQSHGNLLCHFEVIDTGIGIAEDDYGKIFQNFSQVDAGMSRRFGGAGLGLAISKRLVALMNGQIGFKSQSGKGSTFWFDVTLPIAGALPQSSSDNGLKRESRNESEVNPLRILCVDDSPDSQMMMGIMFRKMGHDVTVVGGGGEAITEASQHHYDVVIMDVQMPGINGYEATRQIRKLPGAAGRVPIIALTANAMAGDSEKCLESGMSDYLSKPVQRRELEAALVKWGRMNQRLNLVTDSTAPEIS